MPKNLPPIHPRTILKNHFLIPRQISQAENGVSRRKQLARHLNISPKRVNEICLGKRGITK